MESNPDLISPNEANFIEARDGFYQATVNDDGLPYMRFQGGPLGFLKVLDESTIGFADSNDNLQEVSLDFLTDKEVISIILMDYPNRKCLKICAHVKLIEAEGDPELIQRLKVITSPTEVERAVIFKIVAIDWSYPKNITPRFTALEVTEMTSSLQAELQQLKQTTYQKPKRQVIQIGSGPLPLEITGIRQLTPDVRAFEFRHKDRDPIPTIVAGSHISLPITLHDGSNVMRTYTIANNPRRRDVYEVAVLWEENGRGGSKAIYDTYQLGMIIHADMPQNSFSLHEGRRPTVLIAAGIGIAPIKSMAQELVKRGHEFEMHYAARSKTFMAYRSKLTLELKENLHLYPLDEGKMLDLNSLLTSSSEDTEFYICGPEGLIIAFIEQAKSLGVSLDKIHYQLFKS